MARKLTRKEMREQLYRMLFQLEFHKDAELDEQLALFMDDLQEIREADRIELADKFHGVAAHVEELDSMINDKSTGWKVGRLPKADLTVLRLAVYEIMFDENVPDNVAVNEAVELAKQYCTRKEQYGCRDAVAVSKRYARFHRSTSISKICLSEIIC